MLTQKIDVRHRFKTASLLLVYVPLCVPLCASVTLAAPIVQPLPSTLERQALPSALQRSEVIAPSVVQKNLRGAQVQQNFPARPDARKEALIPMPPVAEPAVKTRRSLSKRAAAPKKQIDKETAMTNEAIRLYEAHDYQAALVLLKELLPFHTRIKDAGMMSLTGYAALKAGEGQLALDSFRQAAEWTEDDGFWLSLVDAQIQLDEEAEAQKILDRLPSSQARDQRVNTLLSKRVNRLYDSGQYALAERTLLESQIPLAPGLLEILGWTQLRLDKPQEAANSFEAAYRQNPSPSAAQGLAFSYQRLHALERLIFLADELQGPLFELSSDPKVRAQIAAGQYARLAVNDKGVLVVGSATTTAQAQGWDIKLSPLLRKRRGDPGQGQLDVRGATLQTEWVGADDQVNLQLDHFTADNGAQRQDGMNTLYALWKHTTDAELERSLGLGLSPTGGVLAATPLGELGLAQYSADAGWNGKLFRQANKESILSMSGASQTDSTGKLIEWGQVLEDGITLGGYLKLPGAFKDWKAEGSLTAAHLSGTNIADNNKLAIWARALRPIEDWTGWRIGADMYVSSFSENQSYYTPGFGGYYSPQTSLSLGPVLAYEGALGPVNIQANAGLGWGFVKQAAADGNPLTGANSGFYPASSSSGLSTHLDIASQWAINRDWTLGFKLTTQTSPDYEEWQTLLYLNRSFRAFALP